MVEAKKSVALRRVAMVLAFWLAACLGLPDQGSGIIRRDGDGAPVVVCPARTTIEVDLTVPVPPVVGAAVEVVATPATIVEHRTSGGECVFDVHPLGRFRWELRSRPLGSSAALAGTSTLRPTLKPDFPGTYEVVLVACPGGCSFPSLGGGTLNVSEVVREIRITAQGQVPIPPETQPYVPPEDPAPRLEPGEVGCLLTADLTSAAWVTVENWGGFEDFRTLSGKVRSSRVSRKDNALNHDSHDHNAVVDPDPSSEGLMPRRQHDMEIEWEWKHYLDRFWPTRGDRIVTRGYWILDCAHGDKTEIHPPVFTAVQRPRAVEVTPDRGFGTDVWVPGIVTDVWIRDSAGEVTRNCSATGLHNVPVLLPGGLPNCLPHLAGFSRNPIQGVYTFDIHLPRDPREVIAPIKEAPPVLVYHRTHNVESSSGPLPVVERDPNRPNVLNVTIDLREFTGSEYSRRIYTAWILPSPDNWGLKRWKLRVTSLDVHDDGDGDLRGDGDWRFWINTNNTDREWLQVFNCSGCVHGHENFDGRPYETGSVSEDRRFGDDLLLFPGQKIYLHAGGYEEDWIWNDATGYVTVTVPQMEGQYSVPSRCRSSGRSGCARYTLNFEVVGGEPVIPTLTDQAEETLQDYTVTLGDLDQGLPLPPIQPEWGLPSGVALALGSDPVTVPLSDHFSVQGTEPNGLADVEDEAFLQQLDDLRSDEERFDAWMTDLRNEADEARETLEEIDVETGLAHLRDLLPPEVWERYFGDVGDLPSLP